MYLVISQNLILKFEYMKKVILNLSFEDRTMDHSLFVNLIPRSDQQDCPLNKHYRARFGTCSCDNHCSWDVCRSIVPPLDCILGTDSNWIHDNVKNAWVAQLGSTLIYNLRLEYRKNKTNFHISM